VLGEGLLQLLVTAGGSDGCLLLLEDLHWADADTVTLVSYLAEAARSCPVLLAVSARDDQLTPLPGVAVVDALDGLAGVTRLRLNRLDDDDVTALAAGCAGGKPVPPEVMEVLLAKAEGCLSSSRNSSPGCSTRPALTARRRSRRRWPVWSPAAPRAWMSLPAWSSRRRPSSAPSPTGVSSQR
jgi:hypothetical protein